MQMVGIKVGFQPFCPMWLVVHIHHNKGHPKQRENLLCNEGNLDFHKSFHRNGPRLFHTWSKTLRQVLAACGNAHTHSD